MRPPIRPPNEPQRLDALRQYDLLDTLPEAAFDDLVALASQICETPISSITLIDEHRQWFKSRVGLTPSETPRDISFCAHAILEPELFEVPDAATDARFANSPLVTGDPYIRFYAGAPLVTSDGHALGTLCVMDRVPRQLNLKQQEALRALGRQVMAQLELRRQTQVLLESEARLFKVLRGCSVGIVINRCSDGKIVDVNAAYSSITSWTREDLIGRTSDELDILDEPSLAQVRSQLVTHGVLRDVEVVFRTRDGMMRNALVGAEIVDLRGEPHSISTFVDITDRKQAETLLRSSHERLKIVARATNDAVWDWDLATNALWWNEGYQTLFGHPLAQAVPSIESWTHFLHPEDLERVLNGIHAAIDQGGHVWSDEYRFGRQDGTYALIFDRGYILRDAQGAPVRMIGAMQDVTARKAAEAEAILLTRRLILATDAASIGIWDWDLERDEWYATPTYSTMLGFDPEHGALDRNTWLERLHPEDQPGVLARIREALAGSIAPYEYEARIRHADGEYRWVHVIGRVLKVNAEGKASRLLGAGTDITERKRAEQHIRQLNRVYAVLSEINQAIVREQDPQVMLNAACRIAVERGDFRMAWIAMARGKDGWLSLTAHAGADDDTLTILRTLLGTEQHECQCAFTLEAFQTGEHGVCNDIEHDPRALLWRDQALVRDYRAMASLPIKVAGRVLGTFNLYDDEPGAFDADELRLLDELALDIAFALEVHERELERGRVEQELRESDDRFRQLAANIQEVFWMSDPVQNRMLYVSPAYEAIWGRSCASLYEAPRDWLDAVHPDDRERVLQSAKSLSQRDEYDETYRIVQPGGEVRWIRNRASAIRTETGEISRVVGTAEDITARRHLEEQFLQSQKMEAIGQLAGGVAHDFNNLLTVIQGYGALLLVPGQQPEDTTEAAQQIVQASERAANLTRQLLAFSRRQVMQPRRMDLNEIINNLIRMLQRILGEDVQLQLELSPQPLLVRADAGMLDQVLMNLVINARDAMPSGGRLVISTSATDITEEEAQRIGDATPGPHACLRVSDTGSGILPKHLSHIFEPFFTTKDPGKGTGLGLATVFGIVTQHRGSLRVNSIVGEGTTIEVLLPSLEPEADPTAPGTAEWTAKPAATGGTETILIVEDEPSVRILTRTLLEREGYRVLEAPNGVEALGLWQAHKGVIHLLLTDIVMPEGLNGLQLAARLQSQDEKLRVLFTSGYSAEIAGRELTLREGENFVQKPCPPQLLLETVRRCLDS